MLSESLALGLARAIIVASPTPLLLLDRGLALVAASDSFCDAFGIDPAASAGCRLAALGSGEWNVPQLQALLAAIVDGTPQVAALEMELARPDRETRCLIVNAKPLVDGGIAGPLLLVAVSDVTQARADARAKSEIIERLDVRLLEIRHRVSNSLQIVASILLRTARRANSAQVSETLTDAHNRVMSVAALERQLSALAEDGQSVDVLAYFTSLCDNVAESMIDDQKPIALLVTGGGQVTPRVSVSLGLIVIELVINALKHAFPDGRSGRVGIDCVEVDYVEVDYRAQGPNWRLCVSDNGVGMPRDQDRVRAGPGTGLGTGMVEALARQLSATITYAPGSPGTIICVECIQVAAVGDGRALAHPALESDGQGQGRRRAG